jgi:hypothetical protein
MMEGVINLGKEDARSHRARGITSAVLGSRSDQVSEAPADIKTRLLVR